MLNDFERRISHVEPLALYGATLDTVQVNIGLRCDRSCDHCHQSASPQRTELMTDAAFAQVLRGLDRVRPALVDVTGGAPELHPRIRPWIDELVAHGHRVQMRTNGSALLDPAAEGLPAFLAERDVRVLASAAPGRRGDRQHQRAIEGLTRLAAVGYGTGRALDVSLTRDGVDSGPDPEAELRSELDEAGVGFGRLVRISNVPVGRYRSHLGKSAGEYTGRLKAAFNPRTVEALACRRGIAVAWDGTLWDCDFNIGAGIRAAVGNRRVGDLDASLARRRISFGPHCYACTAGEGSS